MPQRIVVQSDLGDRAAEVFAGYIPDVYRPVQRGAEPDLWLDLTTYHGGVLVRPVIATDSFLKRFTERIAADHSPVTAFQFELIGKRNPTVTASETRWTDGVARYIDISAECEDMVDMMMEEVEEVDDVARDEISHAVLEALPDAVIPELEVSLTYVSTVSKRVLTLVELLQAGASWEWVDLHGQRALRVTREGESQISVLKPGEIAELCERFEVEPP